MACKNCGEKDLELMHLGKCRRCLTFSHHEVAASIIEPKVVNYVLSLTPFQEKISQELCAVYDKGDVLIDAVCGAGKTEICLALIEKVLGEGKQVGWCVPRREVVLEISKRLATYFESYRVVSVCQGFTKVVVGDIIVCTTHQLYRYPNYFDVLIVDEPDAFPFAGNVTLQTLMHRAVKKNIVYLSATYDAKEMRVLTLPIRPSGILLPVPLLIKTRVIWMRLLWLLYRYRNESCLIFVPTRKMAQHLSRYLRIPFLTSQSENKAEILRDFRENQGKLISTTVLERGVTFENIHVFVVHAQHMVFNEASLVQIAGRAMRGMKPQKGDVIFLCLDISKAVERSIERIKKANHDAQYVLNHDTREKDSLISL